jgi:hypothetical protein
MAHCDFCRAWRVTQALAVLAVACAPCRGEPVVTTLEPTIVCLSYTRACSTLAVRRARLARRYANAPDRPRARAVLAEAETTLVHTVTRVLFPPWHGTPWDFNGTTEVPGQGMIACGYFVSTVLRDAGLRVQRIRLAQQSAEIIVRTLCRETHIKRFRDTPLRTFVETIAAWGSGLYVVGLDCHVGFLLCDSSGVRFVHSTYVGPSMVIDEPADSSVVLEWSRYRVVGALSRDPNVLDAWLRQRPIRPLSVAAPRHNGTISVP